MREKQQHRKIGKKKRGRCNDQEQSFEEKSLGTRYRSKKKVKIKQMIEESVYRQTHRR